MQIRFKFCSGAKPIRSLLPEMAKEKLRLRPRSNHQNDLLIIESDAGGKYKILFRKAEWLRLMYCLVNRWPRSRAMPQFAKKMKRQNIMPCSGAIELIKTMKYRFGESYISLQWWCLFQSPSAFRFLGPWLFQQENMRHYQAKFCSAAEAQSSTASAIHALRSALKELSKVPGRNLSSTEGGCRTGIEEIRYLYSTARGGDEAVTYPSAALAWTLGTNRKWRKG